MRKVLFVVLPALAHAEAVKVVQDPAIRERFLADGADPVGNTPEQFGKFVAGEIANGRRS